VRITQRQFDEASNAAFDAADSSPDEVPLNDRALRAFARALGIEIEKDAEASQSFIWVRRTWADARQGDAIRPINTDGFALDQHAAHVVRIGPTCEWHVDDLTAVTEQDVRDRQYRPSEHRLTYSARLVTLAPLADESAAPFSPPHGMSPDAPVDIRTTQVEADAIELLGGWTARL
jgi:hypothetical protein